MSLTEKATTATFKCPECGTKVLSATNYCVKCGKKVKPKSEKSQKKESAIPFSKRYSPESRRAALASKLDESASIYAVPDVDELLRVVRGLGEEAGGVADDYLSGNDEASAVVWRRLQGILDEAALKIQDAIR